MISPFPVHDQRITLAVEGIDCRLSWLTVLVSGRLMCDVLHDGEDVVMINCCFASWTTIRATRGTVRC